MRALLHRGPETGGPVWTDSPAQQLYRLFSLVMSFWLIWVALPITAFWLGMGTILGWLFLEKAYLEVYTTLSNTHSDTLLLHMDSGPKQNDHSVVFGGVRSNSNAVSSLFFLWGCG